MADSDGRNNRGPDGKVVGLGSRLNAESFRIPASDTRGHSAKEWFRIPPDYAEQMAGIVQGGAFPYKSKGDLIRHAIHRHLHWLDSISPTPLQRSPSELDLISEIVRRQEMQAEFREVMQRASKMINIYIAEEGAVEEAKKLARQIQARVEQMPDGYWKRMFERKLREQHGELLAKPKPRIAGKTSPAKTSLAPSKSSDQGGDDDDEK